MIVVTPQLQNTWTATSDTVPGQLGDVLAFSNTNVGRPVYNTFQTVLSGTAPVACTFQVEISQDGANWLPITLVDTEGAQIANPLDPSDNPLAGTNLLTPIATVYMRINLIAFTPGDDTTVVQIHWTGAGK